VPSVKTGVLTVAVVVTVCVAIAGPLQPAALAVMVDEPLHPPTKVTVPLAEFIEFPAIVELLSKV
jgi:hypothetical protein